MLSFPASIVDFDEIASVGHERSWPALQVYKPRLGCYPRIFTNYQGAHSVHRWRVEAEGDQTGPQDG